MVETGAVLQEYALLDAQHFGVPQRRRRVFLVSVFDPAIAQRCPDPLLPVSESLRGDFKKGKQKGQTVAGETSASFGSGSFGGWTETETAITLSARDYKGIKTIAVEPFVKSRRAQTSEDDKTWIPAEITPTLNSFDVGDTRATTAIVEPILLDGRRVDDVRIYEPPVQTLQARMGTGGNNVPLLAFDTQFGSNANVFEDHSRTLKSSQQSPSVAYPIQDGREMEKHQNGFGVASDGEPSYTLDQTGAQAVAYSVREDAKANLIPAMAVRRLTPLECERLMGWPDDHTRWKADGTEQADTHRYKQCGNGVASPVAQWIAQHMRRINEIQ